MKSYTEEKERYQTLFELDPAGLFHVTEGLEIVDINMYALKLIGLPPDKVIGRRCQDIICMGEACCKLSNPSEEIVTKEFTLNSPDGAQNFVVVSCRNWEIGGEASIIGSITNINERKKLEETIFNHNQKLESIFDGMDDGIFAVDREGIIAAVNRRQA
ncbi:MAG: PAS domain S-box protein, partial [Promethearchaeota archaeon]